MPEVLNKEKLLEQAKLFADQGKLDRAIQEYNKVLQMDPKDHRLKLRVAELYVKLKKTTEAIAIYQEVANSYYDDAFYLKAVTVYKNILRLNPSLLDVNRKLAELYEKMGLVSDAIHQYQIVANMLEQKGMDQDLLTVRQQIVGIAPEVSAHRIRLAEAYQIAGKDEEAINEYEVLVKQIRQSGTPEQLIELYEKILAHRPDNLDMVRDLCATYIRIGDWKKALKRMETSDDLVMQDPELLTQMAEFYARQNQMATAAEKYSDLAELYVTRQEIESAITAYAASAVYAPEEEDHVREVVGELAAGAVEEFAKAIETRKAWLIQREADAESAAEVAAAAPMPTAATTSGAPVKTVEHPVAKVTVVDAKSIKRQVESLLQLTETYAQMGLQDEAKEEFQKATTAFDAFVKTGTVDAALQSRVDAVKAKFTKPVAAAAPVVAKPAPQKPAPAPTKKRVSYV